jgi:hypothetical protein
MLTHKKGAQLLFQVGVYRLLLHFCFYTIATTSLLLHWYFYTIVTTLLSLYCCRYIVPVTPLLLHHCRYTNPTTLMLHQGCCMLMLLICCHDTNIWVSDSHLLAHLAGTTVSSTSNFDGCNNSFFLCVEIEGHFECHHRLTRIPHNGL